MTLLKLAASKLMYLLKFYLLSIEIRAVVVVSVLALYSDDPSSNPSEDENFSVRNENKQKEAGLAQFFKYRN